MNQQAKRWIQALGAVAGILALLNFEVLYVSGVFSRSPVNTDGSTGTDWALLLNQLLHAAVELVVIMALLALTRTVSRRLLRGRFPVLLGALLLLLASYVDVRFEFQGGTLGGLGMVWGMTSGIELAAIPMVAGAWVLWGRRPGPTADLVAAAVPGVWDGGGSVLRIEPDGVFTLTRGGAVSVAGLWESGRDAQPQLVLKVDSATDLGHGWQATPLELELTGHTARLHSGTGMSFLRREPELVLEEAGGYLGAVEVLEAGPRLCPPPPPPPRSALEEFIAPRSSAPLEPRWPPFDEGPYPLGRVRRGHIDLLRRRLRRERGGPVRLQ